MERGLKKKGLACFFAFSSLLVAIGMGNSVQANAFALSLNRSFDISFLAGGVIIFITVFAVVAGGISRIGKICSFFVPFMSVGFFLLCLFAIIPRAGELPSVLGRIFSGAFSLKAVGGGAGGYIFILALRQGVGKGVFSNEAGLGSAPSVHSATGESSPSRAAIWGIAEVFIDTHVICTLSAFVILLYPAEGTAAETVYIAFSEALGKGGEKILSLFIAFFALASVLCWSYYGECALNYLAGEGKNTVFRFIYPVFSLLGALITMENAFTLCEIFNAAMLIPNISSLFLLSREVKAPVLSPQEAKTPVLSPQEYS